MRCMGSIWLMVQMHRLNVVLQDGTLARMLPRATRAAPCSVNLSSSDKLEVSAKGMPSYFRLYIFII